MYNHVGIMGRFVRDPECVTTQSGVTIARFTLACDRDFKNKDTGERETDFINCIAWRRTGEFVRDYFRKGRMAMVEGRIQVSSWVDKDNNKRWRTEVKVENIYFADSKRAVESEHAESVTTDDDAQLPAPEDMLDSPDIDSLTNALPF